MISYDLLWALFKPDEQICITHEDSSEPVGLTLKTMAYETTSTSKFFSLSGQLIEWTGKKYIRVWMDSKVCVRIYPCL